MFLENLACGVHGNIQYGRPFGVSDYATYDTHFFPGTHAVPAVLSRGPEHSRH